MQLIAVSCKIAIFTHRIYFSTGIYFSHIYFYFYSDKNECSCRELIGLWYDRNEYSCRAHAPTCSLVRLTSSGLVMSVAVQPASGPATHWMERRDTQPGTRLASKSRITDYYSLYGINNRVNTSWLGRETRTGIVVIEIPPEGAVGRVYEERNKISLVEALDTVVFIYGLHHLV